MEKKSIESVIENVKIKYGNNFELFIVDNFAISDKMLLRTPYYNVMKYDFAKKMIEDLDNEWEVVEVTYDTICRILYIYVEAKRSVDEEKISIYEHKLCELEDRITKLKGEKEALTKKITILNNTCLNIEKEISLLKDEYSVIYDKLHIR